MKKSLLAIGLTVLILSCKKTTTPEFTPTSTTGTGTLSGNITKTMSSGSSAPAVGVTISVEVKNAQLYPNTPSNIATYSGSQVYTGTTDANGNYSISVTTVGGAGVMAIVTINNITSITDPVTGTQAILQATMPTTTKQLITGITTNYNSNMSTLTNIGTTVTGTATVMGTLKVVYFKENPAGVFTPTSYNLANQPVSLDFDKDPTSQVVKTYNTTTDANGNYSFSVSTTAAAGFNDAAKIYVADYATTQDTIKMGGTQVTGKPGRYSSPTPINIGSITPTVISNGNTIIYSSFSPN